LLVWGQNGGGNTDPGVSIKTKAVAPGKSVRFTLQPNRSCAVRIERNPDGFRVCLEEATGYDSLQVIVPQSEPLSVVVCPGKNGEPPQEVGRLDQAARSVALAEGTPAETAAQVVALSIFALGLKA
jgi:hypothetical protein